MINLLNKFQTLIKLRDKLDNKTILLIILVWLIIICITFSFLIKLQLATIRAVTGKIIRLEKDTDALTKNLALMQQEKIKQKTVSKAKKIIPEEEVSLLLQDISNIANKHNVKIMELKPSKESKAKETKATPTAELTPILITLDLFCSYHNLGSFINDLENAEVFMAVEELKITPQQADYFKQRVSLVLKTYVKK